MIKDKLYSFLKKINWLTVGLLLMLCVIPQVYKEAFSEEGFSVSRLFSSVLYTLPLCFIVASIKRKWAFVVLSAVLMMVSFFETIMVVLYNNFVIAGNIIAALTTTADEGTGFVMSTLHALLWTLPVILAFALSVWLYRKPLKVAPSLCCAGLFAAMSVGFLAYQLKIRWGGGISQLRSMLSRTC